MENVIALCEVDEAMEALSESDELVVYCFPMRTRELTSPSDSATGQYHFHLEEYQYGDHSQEHRAVAEGN
jgi:hypothetical protein